MYKLEVKRIARARMGDNTKSGTKSAHGRLGLAASLLVSFIITAMPSPAVASHCGSAPSGFGGSWASQYSAWCRCMGGSYNSSTTACSGATGGHSGGGSGSSSYGGGMSTGDPFVDAMMPAVQGVFGAIGQGMANMLFGNPQEEARKRAERELAERRAAEAARVRAEEEARRREQEHNALMSTLMPIPGSASGPGPNSSAQPNAPAGMDSSAASAYRKGLLDAEQCYPANAFGHCAAAKPEAQQSCTEQYRAGFAVGDKQRVDVMQAAYETGEDAGKNGEPNNGFTHPDAQGACRNEWIQTYNRGYFQGKTARASR